MTHNHFDSLEKRCHKIQRKFMLRIILGLLSLLFLGYGLFYYYSPSLSMTTLLTPAVAVPKSVVAEKLAKQVDEIPAIEDNTTLEILEKKEDILFLSVHGLTPKIATLSEAASQEAMRSLQEEHELLKHYKENENFETSYALAMFYFKLKSYQEVGGWAKKASQFDTHSDKPRILYAKAKFYLGKRDEAISSLELFLGYIKSTEASELLDFYKGQE